MMDTYKVKTKEVNQVRIVSSNDEVIISWNVDDGDAHEIDHPGAFTDRVLRHLVEGETIHRETVRYFESHIKSSTGYTVSPEFTGDSATQSRNELRNWLNKMLHDMKTGVL